MVANAKVEIHNAVSGYDRTTTTDSKGNFSFPNVPFNPYHMTVTAAGFAQNAQDVEIRSALGVNVKVSLTVASSYRPRLRSRRGRFGGERSNWSHRRGSGIVRQNSPGKPVLVV